MIGGALKIGAVVALSWIAGEKLGGWIAVKAGQGGSAGATTGIKIGTGVTTFVLLGAVLR